MNDADLQRDVGRLEGRVGMLEARFDRAEDAINKRFDEIGEKLDKAIGILAASKGERSGVSEVLRWGVTFITMASGWIAAIWHIKLGG